MTSQPKEAPAAGSAPASYGTADDPDLKAVSRWLEEVTVEVPEPVLRRGALAAITWLVGPPRDTPTRVVPRF